MKKRGSAMTMVLIIVSALLIIGTAVSALVVNTTKLNVKYSDRIDLELAAKSGLNITVEELITDIKGANTVADLPQSSGPNQIIFDSDDDFEKIIVEVTITRNEIINERKNNGYEYTVISRAYNENKVEIYIEESQVVTANKNGNSSGDEEGDTEFIPNKVLNVTNDVELVWSEPGVIDNISYGGKIFSNKVNITQNADMELKELKLKINNNNFNTFISYLDQGTIDKFNRNINGEEIYGSNVQKDSLNNILNRVIIVKGNIDIKSEGSVNINLINSTVIIEGSLDSSIPVNINLKDNSNFIVTDELSVENSLNVELSNNSFMEVSGNVGVSGSTYLELDNSKYVVYEDLTSKTNFIFDLKNNSTIKVLGEVFAPSTINGYLNRSIIEVEGNLSSGTSFDLNLDEGSIINVNGALTAPNKIIANVNNKSYISVKGEMVSSSTGFELNITNMSIISIGLLKAPNKIEINLEKSVCITGDINSQSNVLINLTNSNLIIRGSLFSNSGFRATLFDSAVISLGSVKVPYDAIITNNDRSFFLTIGDFYTENLTIYGGNNSIIPESNIVKTSISYFLTK